MDKGYFAFISYKSEDVEWAIWVQHELEHYHLPASYNGREDVRQDLRPVFRDIDELSAGNLPEQIKQALANSQNLIIICSPQAAESPWENQEVETFISLGRTNRIFPFIVEGNSPSEFFPPALLNLPKSEERLGGDVSKNGRDAAFVKVVAGMLGVGFNSLWNRYEKEKAEEERKQREQRDNLLRLQSRFLAEKCGNLVDMGNSYLAMLIALEILPEDLEAPNRPYVHEAEQALRKCSHINSAILNGHNAGITYATFSPDNKKIISSSHDKTVRIWDADSGQQLALLNHSTLVSYAEYSPDGNTIISFSELLGNTFYFWNAKTYRLLYKQEIDHVESKTFAISPDGRLLAFAKSDGTIHLWDIERRTTNRIFMGHCKHVRTIRYSKDGNRLLSSSYHGTIRIWNISSGENISTFYVNKFSSVSWAEFSPRNDKVVSAEGSKIVVRDTETGAICNEIKASDFEIKCVSYSPDGKYVVSCTADFNLQVWRVANWEMIFSCNSHEKEISSVQFSNDGQRIISASWDCTIRMWDFNHHIILDTRFSDSAANDTMLSPDETRMLINYNNHSISIIDTENHSNRVLLKHPEYVSLKAFSSDGRLLVTKVKNTIRVWNSLTGKLLSKLTYDDDIWSFSLSPDANFIVITFNKSREVRLVDIFSGSIIGSVVPDSNTFGSSNVSYSPSGRYVVLARGRKLCVIDAHRFDAIKYIEVNDRPEQIMFSPNEAYLVYACDQKVAVVDFSKGIVIRELTDHTRKINCMDFSRDSQTLLTGSQDMTIKVWNFKEGSLLDTISGPSWGISFVKFINNDHQIYASSFDGTTRIWDYLPLQRLIDKTKIRFAGRKLTPEERRRFYLE